MPYYCGVDIGASSVKLVVIDEQQHPVARAVRRSGIDYAQSADRCLDEALTKYGLPRDQIRRRLVHRLRPQQRAAGPTTSPRRSPATAKARSFTFGSR